MSYVLPRFTARLAVGAAIAVSCASPQGSHIDPANPIQPLPTLGGLVTYDEPIESASEAVRNAWAHAQDLLQDSPPPLPDEVASGLDLYHWIGVTWNSWEQTHNQRRRVMEAELRSVEERGSRDALFAAILIATVADAVFLDIRALRRRSVVADVERLPYYVSRVLDDLAYKYAFSAQGMYLHCIAIAPGAPIRMRAWRAVCQSRNQEIQEFIDAHSADFGTLNPPPKFAR